MINACRLAVVTVGAALALAACGSEDPAEPAGPVGTRDVPDVGTVLVDDAGATLYFTDADRPDDRRCAGECLKVWHPAEVADGTSLDGTVDGVSSVRLPDGTEQLTYQDKPLYTFDLDTQDEPVSGDNVSDTFDGVEFTWHAVVVEGGGDPAPPEGGYGY